MIKLSPLIPRSRIVVPVPASPIQTKFLESGLKWLRERGWRATPAGSDEPVHFFSTGTDSVRAKILIRNLQDPSSDAIWFARGGYGSGRLLPYLEDAFSGAKPDPKWIIGCSDTTFLLLFISQKWNWPVIHGPMVAGDIARGADCFDEKYLLSILRGSPCRKSVSTEPLEVLTAGPDVTAPLTGGCLSVVTATLGTRFEVETEGKILFLEDAQEKPYRIDRMMQQMRHAGKLNRCVGIVFGEMTNCRQHPDQGYTIQEALRYALDGIDCPVLFGLPSGHTIRPALPLILGARYSMRISTASLELEEMICPSE